MNITVSHNGMWSKNTAEWKGRSGTKEELNIDRLSTRLLTRMIFLRKGWAREMWFENNVIHAGSVRGRMPSCHTNVPPALQACFTLQRKELGRGWKELNSWQESRLEHWVATCHMMFTENAPLQDAAFTLHTLTEEKICSPCLRKLA